MNTPLDRVKLRPFSKIARLESARTSFMKNIQIIDSAVNATFSVFQATDEEFAAIFPDKRDIELVEDLIERIGEESAASPARPVRQASLICPSCLRIGIVPESDHAGTRGGIRYDSSKRLRVVAFQNPMHITLSHAQSAL